MNTCVSARAEGYKPIFNSVSDEAANVLKSKNFRVLRYGEEAILDPASCSLASGKKGALRRNVAKLNRAGVVLTEYCPETDRNPSQEREISELEEQWFADKKFFLSLLLSPERHRNNAGESDT